jgi:effector-binding domain-containing protein
MDVDFGVEVVREFAACGEVRPAKTPSGEVAAATHLGRYDRLGLTHDAIYAWAAANHRTLGDKSWEMYGDWNEDPTKLETRVMYLLR